MISSTRAECCRSYRGYPTPTAKNLYDEDFYVWAMKQAELLRDKRFDELDLEPDRGGRGLGRSAQALGRVFAS